jgi:hypothetical protein
MMTDVHKFVLSALQIIIIIILIRNIGFLRNVSSELRDPRRIINIEANLFSHGEYTVERVPKWGARAPNENKVFFFIGQ